MNLKITPLQNFFIAWFVLTAFSSTLQAQTVCNPSGNIFIVSNYDGGVLNLVVDQNIPNLKIGVVSYEAIQINLSGAFVSNVSEVRYAGYNSSPSNNCGPNISTTVINSAPSSAQVNISTAPSVTSPNPNGSSEISCLYDCDTTTNQGGCNTADEIVDYFMQQFPGSAIYAHRTQYGCYTNPVTVSGAGNCCTATIPAITSSLSITAVSCNGVCDGTATTLIQGGIPPYSVLWSNGDTSLTADSLCPGNYLVNITDSIGFIISQPFIISAPATLSGTFSITADNGTCNGGVVFNPAGGNGGPYSFAWDSCGNAAGSISAQVDSLCAGTCCVYVSDTLGCRDTFCVTVPLVVGISENNAISSSLVFPNPSVNGEVLIRMEQVVGIRLTDINGREVGFNNLKQSPEGVSIYSAYRGFVILSWESGGQRFYQRVLMNER